MSSQGYPSSSSSSSSESKQYTEEEQKLLNFMRQCRSQPMPSQDQFTVSTPIYEQQGMRTNLPEIIHLPPSISNQALLNSSSWSELDHTAATIRNSSSSFRILVQSSDGHSYISIVDPNSSNKDQNHRDTNWQSNSTSSWPV